MTERTAVQYSNVAGALSNHRVQWDESHQGNRAQSRKPQQKLIALLGREVGSTIVY